MGGQTNVMEMEYDHHLVAAHFRQLLARERPDAVHFFHMGRISSSPVVECAKAGVPAFYTPTDFWAVCPTKQLLLPDGSLCDGPDAYAANCLHHLAIKDASAVSAVVRRLPVWLCQLGMRTAKSGIGGRHPRVDMVRSLALRREIVVSRLNGLDAIFAPSRVVCDCLERYGVDKALLRQSAYGIDLDFESPPHQAGPGDRLRVGFIGTFVEHKGAHLLMEALRTAPDLPVELHLFGNATDFPDYYAKLRQLAGDDPRFLFRGTFSNVDIGHVFSKLDALAVPSLWYENTPLVVSSAQACGCPVVASDLGGLSEVVCHEKNGLLFPAGNAKELAAALARLHEDRSLLGRLAANSRPPRSVFDYVEELLGAYQTAIEVRKKVL
jgi:glycosyltransferase involved in cell wall biosynthesis